MIDAAPPRVPTQNIAILHVQCFDEPYCLERIKQEACAVGADLVYGAHYIERPYRSMYPEHLVGTAALRHIE